MFRDIYLRIGKDIREIARQILPNGKYKRWNFRKSECNNPSWEIKVTINTCNNIDKNDIYVDIFPVSVQQFLHFLLSFEYFNDRHWQHDSLFYRSESADTVVKRIFDPFEFVFNDYKWDDLRYLPVRNINWFEAVAYANWNSRSILTSSEYKAVANLRRYDPTNSSNRFSINGLWGIPGCDFEWCRYSSNISKACYHGSYYNNAAFHQITNNGNNQQILQDWYIGFRTCLRNNILL